MTLIPTTTGKAYAITPRITCAVHASNDARTYIATVEPGAQAVIVSPTEGIYVTDPDALVTETFSPAAPTASGSGSGSSVSAHANTIATTTIAGHVRVGGVGITIDGGQLRINFRTEHSGFEIDEHNAVYANTGTNDHPAHGAIAPVATDSAGKFCVPALTTEKMALLEVLWSNKDTLLAAIGASAEEAAAITEATEAMAIAEAAAAAEAAAQTDLPETTPETTEHTYEFEL